MAGTPWPTHADYLLFDLLDTCEAASASGTAAVLEKLPKLVGLRARVAARPKIEEYLQSPARRK